MSKPTVKDVDFSKLPEHIAIIMDGNRRWAAKRFLTKNAGHKAGAETLRKLADKMNGSGFKYLTVFAFSTENWNRTDEEVRGLMSLMSDLIQQYIDDSKKNNIRINIIGDLDGLPAEIRTKSRYLMDLTKNHGGMCVTIALNYGGRDEITRAVQRVSADTLAGKISPDKISIELFSSYLDTKDMPDPDIIVRTSGEQRVSNFLLWQSAYAEYFASPKLWPDFTYGHLLEAVAAYQTRDRRKGS